MTPKVSSTIQRRAKSRLVNMDIQEVSVVDKAANLREFVLLKRDTMTTTEKMTLKLPGDAKQGIIDGLAQALDKATALAAMVGDAEVADDATVPAELSAALTQSSMSVIRRPPASEQSEDRILLFGVDFGFHVAYPFRCMRHLSCQQQYS